VTVVATEALPRAVLRVTERQPIGRRICRRPGVRSPIVAGAARGDIASVRLRVRSVASVTTVVSGESRWNRQRRAAPQRGDVTRRTTGRWPRRAGHVLRVIELHIEAFFESVGKSLQRRVVPIHVRVADRTHGNVRRGELRQVTSRAVLMSGEARSR